MTSKKYSLSDFMSNREVFLLMIGALPQTPQGLLALDLGREQAPCTLFFNLRISQLYQKVPQRLLQALL